MKNILITGATGNIGGEVIRFLLKGGATNRIVAGVRDIDKAKSLFHDYPVLAYEYFDFESPETFDNALKGIDTVFLLRPPHISDIDKYFRPLILKIKEFHIREVLFLSVQGAERSKIIPHNKIERLIIDAGIDYFFLRPSYFMQNLTTTLIADIKTHRKIILPAGKAKFNWIDVENIGETAAILLTRFEEFKNKAIELTGYENEDFYTVTELINHSIQKSISYESVNPFKFYTIKKKEGMNKGMIIVMALLHFLPRLQKDPTISRFFEELTGKQPTKLFSFILREKEKFE